ncbi:NIPSNAP family protein [Inhella proteolytica]|uniref:NIPSNAP family protein n=1 Tax=Inhella proteolytica TaxID=2795029 RepID=A0A931J0X5_9BURK|nr:NIPSNAP family protein [Inhella proteolytica]MBH9577479.1 NIPSNAP family protein [Inhella proteolytica]
MSAENRVLEIRSYKLQPGSGAEFHRLVAEHSVPLLRAWGMDVVRFGPSLHEPDAYFLMRAFNSLAHLEQSQAAFYATPAWRQGPREAIVSRIVSDANTVVALPERAIEALRDTSPAAAGPAPTMPA